MPLGPYLRSRGIKDGVLGGRRGWLILGVAVWSGRLLKKLVMRSPEVVSVEKLEPGQSVTVTALAPQERRRRRA